MEPGFTYKINNQELIDVMKNDFYSDPSMIKRNGGDQNFEKTLLTIKENDIWNLARLYPAYWDNHMDLYHYLNENTYPKSPEYVIDKSWMKYYPEGSFSGLHQDSLAGEEDHHHVKAWTKEQYTNVILIDQPENIIGGIIVIAGDSYKINFKDCNAENNLRERLYTRFLKTPGAAVVWDGNAVHGLSKIEKGHRLVLVCTKVKKDQENG